MGATVVVVVGAAVVVVARVVVVEAEPAVDSACVVDVDALVDEVVDDIRADFAAAVVEAAVAEVVAVVPVLAGAVWARAAEDASTVLPAVSAKPIVPITDPPASQKVRARALRMPRLRLAPVGCSREGDTVAPSRNECHGLKLRALACENPHSSLGKCSAGDGPASISVHFGTGHTLTVGANDRRFALVFQGQPG